MQTNRCRAPSPATADQGRVQRGNAARTSSSNWPAERSVSTSPSRPHLRVARRFARCWRGTSLECTVVRTCRFCASSGELLADNREHRHRRRRGVHLPGLREGGTRPGTGLQRWDYQRRARPARRFAARSPGPRTYLEPPEGEPRPGPDEVRRISATTDDVDPVRVDSLDLHPGIQQHLEGASSTCYRQSLAVEHGATDGEDQLVVSATATGKTLIGEMAGLDRVLNSKGKMLFLVPLVALANQKYEKFQERYGDMVDVTLQVSSSRVGGDGNRFDPPPTSSSAPTRASTTRCGRGRTWVTSGRSSSTKSTPSARRAWASAGRPGSPG